MGMERMGGWADLYGQWLVVVVVVVVGSTSSLLVTWESLKGQNRQHILLVFPLPSAVKKYSPAGCLHYIFVGDLPPLTRKQDNARQKYYSVFATCGLTTVFLY